MAWLWQNTGRDCGGVAADFPWVVSEVGEALVRLDGQAAEAGAAPVIARVAGEPERWALITAMAGNVRVNGVPVRSGIRMLQDRDLVASENGTVLFSTERLAEIEAFAGTDGSIHCARCKLEIQEGDDVVRCPGCQAVMHETGKRRCFSYRDAGCPFCKYPGTLDGQLLWTPASI